ncbi:flavin-binding monooxygenase-like domain-containing protein [Ditylenchus destructor]|nr:flavin-binding monooxygenase-like domain-containing protein [Ditylenchus destructor]
MLDLFGMWKFCALILLRFSELCTALLGKWKSAKEKYVVTTHSAPDDDDRPQVPPGKRCAIIGAGASGMPSARWALAYGFEPVVFETTNEVGGMWCYKSEETELASVMKSTVINTSKEMTAFSDFPPPAEFANFMHNSVMHKYFKLYGKHHNLYKHIRFNHRVEQVRRAPDYKETGRWVVDFITADGTKAQEVFDAVLVASGHHYRPHWPTPWPGQDQFKGRIIHSHDYKDPSGFEDGVSVVVGIGNSGVDVAVEQSRVARETYLSTRRGAWIFHKVAKYGRPFDFSFNRRLISYVKKLFPRKLFAWYIQSKLNKRFDHAKYGLKPNHDVWCQQPTVNETISNRIISGLLAVKPNIQSFTEHGIVWDDGSVTEHVDNVILCTGFLIEYPMLENGTLVPVTPNNEVPTLYKFTWPANLADHNTLAIIGNLQPIGSIMPIAEMQARVFFDVLAGRTKLPTEEDMFQDIHRKRDAMDRRYVKSLRHTIQVDFVDFMDELGDMIGCTPYPSRLLWKAPSLAWKCIFGQVTSYQYRVFGPHSWSGAVQAALGVDERVDSSMRHRFRRRSSLTSN